MQPLEVTLRGALRRNALHSLRPIREMFTFGAGYGILSRSQFSSSLEECRISRVARTDH